MPEKNVQRQQRCSKVKVKKWFLVTVLTNLLKAEKKKSGTLPCSSSSSSSTEPESLMLKHPGSDSYSKNIFQILYKCSIAVSVKPNDLVLYRFKHYKLYFLIIYMLNNMRTGNQVSDIGFSSVNAEGF